MAPSAGPYAFQEQVLPPFSHNPTIRKVPGGYVIFYIGGWTQSVRNCSSDGHGDDQQEPRHGQGQGSEQQRSLHDLFDEQLTPSPPPRDEKTCVGGATVDRKGTIRQGGDYKDVYLPAGSNVSACIAACCADTKCEAFSFNQASGHTRAPGCSSPVGTPCCKLKSMQPPLEHSGCALCTSGIVPTNPCKGNPAWPRSCGPSVRRMCLFNCTYERCSTCEWLGCALINRAGVL